jgi:hypothetical protein
MSQSHTSSTDRCEGLPLECNGRSLEVAGEEGHNELGEEEAKQWRRKEMLRMTSEWKGAW